jgi:phosphatidylglycerophosphate synthase
MVLLQAYMWCDNADGAHARRTNQCSPFGEFLDHGLDQLNTVYIGYLTAMSLGVPPLWWVILALIIPGAGAFTYWEQSETGIFRLGLLNQVESLSVLSVVLTVSGILGRYTWTSWSLFGIVTVQQAMLLWSSSTILFGMARAMVRVVRVRGVGALIPAVGLLSFGGALVLATWTGAVNTILGVTLATGVNVYVGMRMLTNRLHGESPRLGRGLMVSSALLFGLAVAARYGFPVSPQIVFAVVVVVCGVFGVCAIGDTRRSIEHLGGMSTR